MANYYWPIVAATITLVIVSFAIPRALAEVFPWRNLWKQRNAKLTVTTKSYKGKTVLITGANGAFGSRAAKIFADRDVETLILVDVKDCADVKAQIEAEYPPTTKTKPTILVWQVDMMSYASCQALAKKARELKSLDHVLMTAGILSFNRRESPEGWETCTSFPYLKFPFRSSKKIITQVLALCSRPSQLHLHRPSRPPPTPSPQILPDKSGSPSTYLRHHIWSLSSLTHHVRPQARLIP